MLVILTLALLSYCSLYYIVLYYIVLYYIINSHMKIPAWYERNVSSLFFIISISIYYCNDFNFFVVGLMKKKEMFTT